MWTYIVYVNRICSDFFQHHQRFFQSLLNCTTAHIIELYTGEPTSPYHIHASYNRIRDLKHLVNWPKACTYNNLIPKPLLVLLFLHLNLASSLWDYVQVIELAPCVD